MDEYLKVAMENKVAYEESSTEESLTYVAGMLGYEDSATVKCWLNNSS